MVESADAFDITAELPGVDPKNIDVQAAGDMLIIRGEKKSEKETKNRDWRMSECSYGAFARTMQLPFAIEEKKIEASFDKGVLKVHVPKPPEAKVEAKKIPIKS